jgi:NADH-quinone oxidoreductase subunit A
MMLFHEYIPVLILMLLGALIVLVAGLVSRLLRPHHPSELKDSAYECGEPAVGAAWSSFNVRFYVVGLIFIIFDVEAALMYPVAAVYKMLSQMGLGGLVLVEIMIFMVILVSGLVYCWAKGDLDWVRSYVEKKPV